MADEVRSPQTESELIAHLRDTLVKKEVIEPMDKIGWQYGTPPPPGPSDDPKPTDGAPAAAPAPAAGTTPTPAAPAAAPTNAPAAPSTDIDWDALKDPSTGLYAGKYKSKEEAVKGMGHVVNMAKSALNERASLAQENQRLQTELEQLRQTRTGNDGASRSEPVAQVPVSRAGSDKAMENFDAVLSNIVKEGGLLDEDSAKALRDGLREVITASSRATFEETRRAEEEARALESKKWNEVDEYMKTKHPDSVPFADEIGLFVQSDPLVRSAVEALAAAHKEREATELAWVSFQRARGLASTQAALADAKAQEEAGLAKDQVRQEVVDAARKDAGVLGSAASGVHEGAGAGVSDREEIEAAAKAMRAYGATPGNPAAAQWRHLVIGQYLDPKVFGPQG